MRRAESWRVPRNRRALRHVRASRYPKCEYQPVPSSEMFQRLPFPFPNAQFPPALGAVVQQTVLTGELPALEVLHTSDGSWAVGDGINDPNLPGASLATHMAHVVALNSSVAGLATMAPGHIARRVGPGEPWTIHVLDGWGND